MFPAQWNDDGLLFYLQGLDPLYGAATGFVVGTLAEDGPHLAREIDSALPTTITVRWRELVALAAVEPWPAVRLSYRSTTVVCDETFRPRSPREHVGFERGAELLFEHCARFAPARLERGWLDVQPVAWERVARMPGDETTASAGAYRSAAGGGEPVVARRAPPSVMETLAHFLASGPSQPFGAHPREVVVTDRELYARRRDGSVFRLPLAELRLGRGAPDRDSVFVFGRSTRLVLPARRDPCPVAAALWSRLDDG